jgi:microsomal dipeptidase-like Zn-dependent dipeptidase
LAECRTFFHPGGGALALRFGTPIAGRDKPKSDHVALLHLFLGGLREPFASWTFVSDHDPRQPRRNHLAFEPRQARDQALAAHFRQPGWNSSAEAFNVTLELVRRAYTKEQIGKLWSGNLLRVWGEVEKVAQGLQTGPH